MPSMGYYNQLYKHSVECQKIGNQLLLAKMVKVGDKYNWPLRFQDAWTTVSLESIMVDLFATGGFQASINGSSQFEVTGTI